MATLVASVKTLKHKTEVNASDLKQWLETGLDLQLVDVREPSETTAQPFGGAQLIPLGQIVARRSELVAAQPVVVLCKGGVRSAKAIAALREAGYRGTLINLVGGIVGWTRDVGALPE